MPVRYAGLMGSVLVVGSLPRVLRPERVHGRPVGTARVLFSASTACALTDGGPDVLRPFPALEIAWGVLRLALCIGRRRAI